MTSIRSFLTAMAVILIVACGGNPEPNQAENQAAEDVAIPEAAAQPEAAAPAREPAPVDESAADTPEGPAVADDEIVLAAATAPARAEAVPQKYSEGRHYKVLTTAQGTSSSPDVIEVAEVFWYGCPHCYNFDPHVEKWKQNLPDGVELVRLPVMWNPTNEIHARMFYTADALGKLDEMHGPIFREMHINRKTLTEEAVIEELFDGFGVSSEEFSRTFRSFPVETRLKKAKNLTQRYRIQSVPVLVVNGKYVVTGPGIKNFDDMIAVADELIAREQAER
ncbi:MAG: thiol:disulfide interchange protein DsbA/DsbL [Methyloligellaceae bacterium]